MKLKNTSLFSKKITFLNFLATVLVVLFHSVPNLRYGIPLDMNSPFIYMVFVLCQAGVPMFFFLSAVLFYKTCSSYNDIIVKFSRRFKTLLVPYILWNTLFVSIFYVLVHVDVFHQVMNMGLALDSFKDIFIGIIDSRFTPLWFVKVLMFYTLLAPVIYFLLKRKYIFWTAFVAITIKALLCNPQEYDSFWMWLPIYLTGGYFGMHRCKIKKSNIKIVTLAAIFVAAYLLVAYDMEFLLLYRFISPVFIWIMIDWMLGTYLRDRFEVKEWMTYTFFIYCCHHFVLNILQKIVVKMFSPDCIVLNLTFVISPIITILSLIKVAELLSHNRFYKILTGGR